MTDEKTAREVHDALCLLHADQLQEAYEGVRGRVIGLDSLERLATLEEILRKEAAALNSALTEARDKVRQTEQTLTDATAALSSEQKATQRRERLAHRMRIRWVRSAEMAVEAEAEQQSADNWNAK